MKTLHITILLSWIGLIPLQSQELGYINDPDGYANFRLEPSGKSDIIGIIISGQEFQYYPDNTDWWKVHFQNRTGFIHKSRINDFKKVKSEIGKFFQVYYSTDRNNAELGEGNNEKLFLLTQDFPLAILTAFCEQRKEIQAFMTSEYESPIHNLIDLQLIYSRLISVKSPCSETYKIDEALKAAAKKTGLDLKDLRIDYAKLPAENSPKTKHNLTNINFTAKIKDRPITYYLNHPDIDKYSKMFYQGQFQLYDNSETFGFLDSLMTQNNDTRPFYFYVFNSVLSLSDGSLSEYVAEICLKYFEKQPCEFLNYIKNDDYKANISKWNGFIGWQIYSNINFDKFVISTNRIISDNCPELFADWNNLKNEIGIKLEE
jgi:hypothetical protein